MSSPIRDPQASQPISLTLSLSLSRFTPASTSWIDEGCSLHRSPLPAALLSPPTWIFSLPGRISADLPTDREEKKGKKSKGRSTEIGEEMDRSESSRMEKAVENGGWRASHCRVSRSNSNWRRGRRQRRRGQGGRSLGPLASAGNRRVARFGTGDRTGVPIRSWIGGGWRRARLLFRVLSRGLVALSAPLT